MNKFKLSKIEEIYLNVFKITLLFILTIALVCSLGLLVKGLIEITATPKKVVETPVQKMPFSIDADQFLRKIDPKPIERREQVEPLKSEPTPDPMDLMIENHLQNIWPIYESFQKNCHPPILVDKEVFLKSFPRHILRNWFRQYGNDFAVSQASFLNTILSNKNTIDVCVKKEGKGQIFSSALEYHYKVYSNWMENNARIEREAKERVLAQRASVENRAMVEKEKSKFTFMAALYSFGVFMSITMLLIFSKIESNLRGFHQKGSAND